MSRSLERAAIVGVLAAGAMAFTPLAQAQQAYDRNYDDNAASRHSHDDTAALAIGAGIIGLALGAVLANDGHYHGYYHGYPGGYYYPPYPRPYYYPAYPRGYYYNGYPRGRYYGHGYGGPGYGGPGYGGPGYGGPGYGGHGSGGHGYGGHGGHRR